MKNLSGFICIFLLFGLIVLNCAAQKPVEYRSPIKDISGPRNQKIDKTLYHQIYYVSQVGGNDKTGDGTEEKPWQTVHHALSSIKDASENSRIAVFVSMGEYGEATIRMKDYVDLFGGFDDVSWQHDIFKYRTILGGNNKRRVLIGCNNATLDGFVITNGIIRGKGAGILCDHVSPHISNNVFANNKTLTPIPWNPEYWHEVANDGGAIQCQNNASPVIDHNLFINNYTENGRGAAISFYKKCGGSITHNVFMNNTSGLNDPARSSDAGAVSVFDWCNPVIKNNVFIHNKSLANNDGGAMFVALWSSPIIDRNIFVDNECGDDAGALFVGGQEHRYDSALDPLPSEKEFFVSITNNVFVGNKNPSKNSGAMRFTMESRGEFVNNIVAHNTGIYFQRSEVNVINNTILDDFLFIETKESLKPGLIQNTILLANVDIQTDVPVRYCNINLNMEGDGNFSKDPKFENNWIDLLAASSNFSRSRNITDLYVPSVNLGKNVLANRIFKAGDRWGVIHSNEGSNIRVLGNYSGDVSFQILPTYHLQHDSQCIDKGIDEYIPDHDFEGDPRSYGTAVDIGADEYIR